MEILGKRGKRGGWGFWEREEKGGGGDGGFRKRRGEGAICKKGGGEVMIRQIGISQIFIPFLLLGIAILAFWLICLWFPWAVGFALSS